MVVVVVVVNAVADNDDNGLEVDLAVHDIRPRVRVTTRPELIVRHSKDGLQTPSPLSRGRVRQSRASSRGPTSRLRVYNHRVLSKPAHR
ncbi:hypothetical protein RRG08_060449 [Elysia crispata]|uniref:Uncharacterized protein n=1 Tax=Elysia crispata TaxID=231223 RepID=A0AAE1B031_9GAST|nr:hypothetical protein RRG08_060449 [Elysia crispata]